MDMKKTAVALAVLISTGAFAQSSYTLFGVVDLGIGNYSGATASVTKLTSSGLSSSQIGVRGSEALAGGMGGHFWLEAGINPQSGGLQTTNTNNISTGATGGGGLTFNRRSTLSLTGGFGELRLGRDYTPGFWSKTIFEPFGTLGVGSAFNLSTKLLGENTVRASNSLSWLYNIAPNGGSHGLGSKGLYAQAMYAWGGNITDAAAATPTKSTDGNLAGLRVGYADGGMNIAFASERTQNSATTYGGS
ncbi:MAG: porin, partial [Gammaproteobacteria bacterium]|nr:porin [Gammaproteobacteria bacterium]